MSAARKVVLYNPRAVFGTLPLALLALASALDRRRFTPVVIDGRLERNPHARLAAEARDALALGVTVLTGAPLKDALAATRAAKAANPGLPVVWGGWHPSLFAAECVAEGPGVDVSVVGQGEETFAELLQRLAERAGLEGCAGTLHRTPEGALHANPPRPLRALDSLPAHDYGLVDVERYFALKGRRQLDYVSSLGCRFRCAFCADPSVYRRGWTGLSPERLGHEVAYLERRYAAQELAFQDETFFTQPARLAAVCQQFLTHGVRLAWSATLRADQGARLDEAAYALARRAGLRRVMVGVESGSQAQLDWMKKDATVEQVLLTAERLARHEIAGIFNFIVGFPGEPREACQATLALLKRVRRLSPRFDTPVFYYRPYPGTPIAEQARAQGHAFPQTLAGWADFDYVGARGPWVSARQYAHVERLKFYARHAWGPGGRLRAPLRALARWRCEHDAYGWPLEKAVIEWLRPPVPVS